jgi:ornithine decarboxylase
LYLDTGVFHGLVEAMEAFGFSFPMLSERDGGPRREFVVAGPTCDSADVISRSAVLPEALTLGDRLYILSAGAYTNSLECYNGIPFPPVFIENQ